MSSVRQVPGSVWSLWRLAQRQDAQKWPNQPHTALDSFCSTSKVCTLSEQQPLEVDKKPPFQTRLGLIQNKVSKSIVSSRVDKKSFNGHICSVFSLLSVQTYFELLMILKQLKMVTQGKLKCFSLITLILFIVWQSFVKHLE